MVSISIRDFFPEHLKKSLTNAKLLNGSVKYTTQAQAMHVKLTKGEKTSQKYTCTFSLVHTHILFLICQLL